MLPNILVLQAATRAPSCRPFPPRILFQPLVSHEVAVKMLARAAVI